MPEPDTYRPHTSFRIERWLWKQFGIVAGPKNRASVLRAFIYWYLHVPGAELPDRPPRHPGT